MKFVLRKAIRKLMAEVGKDSWIRNELVDLSLQRCRRPDKVIDFSGERAVEGSVRSVVPIYERFDPSRSRTAARTLYFLKICATIRSCFGILSEVA